MGTCERRRVATSMSLTFGQQSFADIEGGFKEYLRTANLSGVGTRVFLGAPRGGASSYPIITIFRIPGGGPVSGADYPMDAARLQFDVWGNVGGKIEAQAVASLVVSTLLDTPCGTLLSEAVRLVGVSQVTVAYVPDPGDGRPRYSVSCVVQAQAV